MSGTISSMGAGSSLTLAGTTASTVAISGAVGDGASINVSEGNAVTWTHDGAAQSTTATITIGEGASFKDNSNYKYALALSGKLSGAGTLISGVATTDGQGDGIRAVTLSGSTANFTGTWELETASDSNTSGNRRVNGILNSSDGVFGGVISFTDSSADSSKTSSTLSLAKDMKIGGLKGTLSNTIVQSSDSTARALTINTVDGASYDYAGTIASTISSLTKTGTGTQTLSGDNSAFAGDVTVTAGTLEAGSASALGTGKVSVESGAKLGLVANVTVADVADGITLADGAKIVIDMSSVSETESFTLALITGTKLTYGTTSITSDNADSTLKNVIEFSGWGESLNDWTQKLAFDNESKKLSLSLTKIPEPSAFGLLAGVGALVFVAARRRRRAK